MSNINAVWWPFKIKDAGMLGMKELSLVGTVLYSVAGIKKRPEENLQTVIVFKVLLPESASSHNATIHVV